MKSQIGLIKRKSLSDWKSCQSIIGNLRKGYLQAFEGRIIEIDLDSEVSDLQLWNQAKEILKMNLQQLVFIDHKPNPSRLISALHSCDPSFSPKIKIHVFGDFVLDASIYLQNQKALNHFDIQWICASQRQADLLGHLIQDRSSIQVTPFAVQEEHFYFNSKLRQDFRSKWNIQPEELTFIYTGRISVQKNVLKALKAFHQFQKVHPQARMFVAGSIDDLGTPYLGKKGPKGLMAFDLAQNLGKAQYLGDLDSESLNQALNGSDVFISLSSHNDEDFGMSPAEAAMTGLPMILSAWGGYLDFQKNLKNSVSLIRTKIGADKIEMEDKEVIHRMIESKAFSDVERQEQQMKNRQAYSLGSVSQKLRSLPEPPSRSGSDVFTEDLAKVASHFAVRPDAPFCSGKEYNKIYRQIYSSYAESNP